jgi:hypothetical protein
MNLRRSEISNWYHRYLAADTGDPEPRRTALAHPCAAPAGTWAPPGRAARRLRPPGLPDPGWREESKGPLTRRSAARWASQAWERWSQAAISPVILPLEPLQPRHWPPRQLRPLPLLRRPRPVRARKRRSPMQRAPPPRLRPAPRRRGGRARATRRARRPEPSARGVRRPERARGGHAAAAVVAFPTQRGSSRRVTTQTVTGRYGIGREKSWRMTVDPVRSRWGWWNGNCGSA